MKRLGMAALAGAILIQSGNSKAGAELTLPTPHHPLAAPTATTEQPTIDLLGNAQGWPLADELPHHLLALANASDESLAQAAALAQVVADAADGPEMTTPDALTDGDLPDDEEDVADLDEPEVGEPLPDGPEASDASPEDSGEAATEFAEGAKLQKQKKYAQARALYEQIIRDYPAGQTAGRARWQIAKTFESEGQLSQAIPVLEMILADASEVSPKLRGDTLSMLAATRQSMASEFAKFKKYDAAIAALQPTVSDARSTNESVRGALRSMARYHLAAQRPSEAVDMYRELIKRPASDVTRLNDLSEMAQLTPSAIEEFEKFIQENPATPPNNLARAHVEMGKVYLREKQLEQAARALETALSIADVSRNWRREAMVGQAGVALAVDDVPAAVAIYREVVRMPVRGILHVDLGNNRIDLERLQQIAPEADIAEEVAIYLGRIDRFNRLTLTGALPSNDVFGAVFQGRVNEVVARYQQYLRRSTGRVPPGTAKAITTQLEEGGSSRPFIVSDFSKSVAQKIPANSRFGKFLRPLLLGEHQTAARIAWQEARLAREAEARSEWLVAARLAMRCQEQTRAGQATILSAWLEGKPVADAQVAMMLDNLAHQPLPYEPSEPAVEQALAKLNKLPSPELGALYRALSGVVADNDAVLVGVGAQSAARHYKLHQWRTAGREDEVRLAEVAAQLKHGGEERPFVISEQARQLAVALDDSAPLADYLKPLLTGDQRTAARVAWQRARKANSDVAYQHWIEAVVAAVRSQDQSLAGRAADFSLWTQGKLKGPNGQPISANPLADYLSE